MVERTTAAHICAPQPEGAGQSMQWAAGVLTDLIGPPFSANSIGAHNITWLVILLCSSHWRPSG